MRYRVWYKFSSQQYWTLWHRDFEQSPEGYRPEVDDAFSNQLEADAFARWKNGMHQSRILFQTFPIGTDPNLTNW